MAITLSVTREAAKDGRDFLKATQVIVDHRTARLQEKMASFRGWALAPST